VVVSQPIETRYRLAIDVGGTFIDYALLDELSGELVIEKQPATPARIADELIAGMGRLPASAAAIDRLFHGTTVALNVMIQGRGARVGLLTTAGFRDVLEVGRGGRPEMYNFLYMPPVPLVERYLRREVPERITARGQVIVPLDLDAVDREVDGLIADGIEALAICFLHAYADPAHEHQAVERALARHPQLLVTASSDIVREWREFDRTSTTVLNAYLRPFFSEYLATIGRGLHEEGYSNPLALMQSNGGVIRALRAAELPVRTLESGPAGGVIGAQALVAELGCENVICTDVGGTSYDVALIRDGEILERTQASIADRRVLGAAIEIVSIGAGGGSIAWVDHRGSVRVGPQSAGADPGPACFGSGGTEPTVTDCHLVLGRLDSDRFLGSRLRLDIEAARRAIALHVAEPTRMSVEEAAAGILAIAETNMTYAIRSMTVERGLDPRDFALLAYGGGGGLFAAATADELEIDTVIVPRAPANFSAWGMLMSDYREDVASTNVRLLDASAASSIVGELAVLSGEAVGELAPYGFEASAIDTVFRADLRYVHQEHTVTVPLDRDWVDDPPQLLEGTRVRFVGRHRELYGHGSSDAPIEVVTLRCRASAHVSRPRLVEWEQLPQAEPVQVRQTYFREASGFVATDVYQRDDLGRDQRLVGPAIIEEWTTTILVPPGWSARIDHLGDVVLERSQGPVDRG
jgi:N-methylhydantoinase A